MDSAYFSTASVQYLRELNKIMIKPGKAVHELIER